MTAFVTTADDITDEMERRLIRKGVEFGWFSEDDINDRDTRDKVRALLTAALTEPPRPEGAEEIEALIEASLPGDALSDAQVRELADFLAGRGVRVVTEEQR